MYKGWTENELKSSKSPKTLVQDLQKITCSGCMGEKKKDIKEEPFEEVQLVTYPAETERGGNVEVLPAFTL